VHEISWDVDWVKEVSHPLFLVLAFASCGLSSAGLCMGGVRERIQRDLHDT
jgi:hypothetical protein